MGGRGVLRLRRPRRRTVAMAVLRRTQVRTALQRLADTRIWGARWRATGFRGLLESVVRGELGGGPLPDVANHVDQTERVGRKGAHRRSSHPAPRAVIG